MTKSPAVCAWVYPIWASSLKVFDNIRLRCHSVADAVKLYSEFVHDFSPFKKFIYRPLKASVFINIIIAQHTQKSILKISTKLLIICLPQALRS